MSMLARWRATLDRPQASYQLVVGTSAILLGFGLIMVLSASSVHSFEVYGNSYYVFIRQLIWALLGVGAAYLVTRMPLKMIRALAVPALVFAFATTLLTLVPGFGIEVNGNKNWIGIGQTLRFQPSEVAKLSLVLWSAHVYAGRVKLLNDPMKVLLPVAPVGFALALIVVFQRDLGTALILFAILGGMLWVGGLPTRLLATLGVILAGLVAVLAIASPNRMRRLTTFLDPFADPAGTGYQAANGLMALASGHFWGVGLGASQQKWGRLPEAHTDFIFAVIGEELGLFGTLVLLALFGMLAFVGTRIAVRARDPFVHFAAAGITVWIMIQAIVNIAMVLGLAPVIGIPLPLISYGGSGLLPTLVAIGLLIRFADLERQPVKASVRKPRAKKGK